MEQGCGLFGVWSIEFSKWLTSVFLRMTEKLGNGKRSRKSYEMHVHVLNSVMCEMFEACCGTRSRRRSFQARFEQRTGSSNDDLFFLIFHWVFMSFFMCEIFEDCCDTRSRRMYFSCCCFFDMLWLGSLVNHRVLYGG